MFLNRILSQREVCLEWKENSEISFVSFKPSLELLNLIHIHDVRAVGNNTNSIHIVYATSLSLRPICSGWCWHIFSHRKWTLMIAHMIMTSRGRRILIHVKSLLLIVWIFHFPFCLDGKSVRKNRQNGKSSFVSWRVDFRMDFSTDRWFDLNDAIKVNLKTRESSTKTKNKFKTFGWMQSVVCVRKCYWTWQVNRFKSNLCKWRIVKSNYRMCNLHSIKMFTTLTGQNVPRTFFRDELRSEKKKKQKLGRNSKFVL